MKKFGLIAGACALLLSGEAVARPLSMMEWMDPKSMDIWRSLTPAEKAQSVHAIMKDDAGSQRGMGGMAAGMASAVAGMGGAGDVAPADKAAVETKVVACLDKETADPEYQGSVVTLMTPFMYCSMKYQAIAGGREAKRK